MSSGDWKGECKEIDRERKGGLGEAPLQGLVDSGRDCGHYFKTYGKKKDLWKAIDTI